MKRTSGLSITPAKSFGMKLSQYKGGNKLERFEIIENKHKVAVSAKLKKYHYLAPDSVTFK